MTGPGRKRSREVTRSLRSQALAAYPGIAEPRAREGLCPPSSPLRKVEWTSLASDRRPKVRVTGKCLFDRWFMPEGVGLYVTRAEAMSQEAADHEVSLLCYA